MSQYKPLIHRRTASPSTEARGLIDHLSYPHIIDEILYHADSQLLLTFRRTSKPYAERCLDILAHHVIVYSQTGPLVVKSSHGDLPRFSGYWGVGRRIKSRPWFFHHSRIVDIHDTIGPLASELLAPSLKNLETLRILSSVNSVKTGRYRLDLIHYTPRSVVVFGDLPDFDHSNHGFYVWTGTTLPATRKVVWTVSRITPSVSRSSGNYVFYSPHRVERAVLHFRFCHTEDVETMLARLARIVSYVVTIGPFTRMVIVDLDQVHPECIERMSQLVHTLVANLGDRAARVTFMTGEQYCAAYGAGQYRIETCEKLW